MMRVEPVQGALPGPQTAHVTALDGLRGVAIALVVLDHFSGDVGGSLPLVLLKRLSAIGWSGVDLFFVLSGFLITGILWDSKSSATYFRSFYVRRVLRIFPLYYAVLLVVFLFGLPLAASPEAQWLRDRQAWFWLYGSNVLLAAHGGSLPSSTYVDLNHFWSLAIEEHFYLVWPAAVLWLSRRTLMRLCVAIMVLAPLARVAFIVSGHGGYPVYVLTPLRMDSLIVGAFVALALRGQPSPWLAKIARTSAVMAGVALAAIVAAKGMSKNGQVMQSAGYTCLAIVGAGALIEALDPSQPLARVLSWRALRVLGRYSYGIYVFHGLLRPVFFAMLPGLRNRFGQAGDYLYLVTAITASVVVAFVSYEWYEARFLRLKDRFPYERAALMPAGVIRRTSVS